MFLNANKEDVLYLATTELNLEIIIHTEVINGMKLIIIFLLIVFG